MLNLFKQISILIHAMMKNYTYLIFKCLLWPISSHIAIYKKSLTQNTFRVLFVSQWRFFHVDLFGILLTHLTSCCSICHKKISTSRQMHFSIAYLQLWHVWLLQFALACTPTKIFSNTYNQVWHCTCSRKIKIFKMPKILFVRLIELEN